MARVVSADEGEDLQINNILLHPQLWRDEDLGFSGRASSIHSPDNGLLQPYSNGSSHFSQQLPYSSMDEYAVVSNCCRSLDDFVPFVDIARISTLSEATTPKPPLQATNQPPTVSSGNTSTGSCKQQTSRERRKIQKKRIVCVPLSKGTGRPNGEGRSSDIWAWRKYGQKPIKGSPYPRGYYKCSSCKGCSARKQVEISKNDPSMLIITYTFDHNHPMPTNHTHANPSQISTSTQVHTATEEKLSKPGQEEATSSEAFQTPDCSIDSSTMLIDPLAIDAIMAKREASVDIKMMYNIPSANYLSTSQELEEIFAELEELPEPSTNFGRATIKGEPLDGEAIDGSVMTSLDPCNDYAMWSSSSSNLHRMVNT